LNVVVVGAGAMGSILAGHLVRAGHAVTLLERGERARYLKERGITISGVADFTARCTVLTDAGPLSRTDLLIVTVKTYQSEAALASVAHLEPGAVLSLQNGVLKNEQLARVFGPEKVLGAVALLSGELLPHGEVRFTMNECLHLGELPEGVSERVKRVVAAFNQAGIHAAAAPGIQTIEWSKFVGWVAYVALSVLTRLETHKFLSDPDTALIGVRIMKETAAIADRLGIPLEDNAVFPVKTIASVSEGRAVEIWHEAGKAMATLAPAHRVSALQDLERGTHLEVEETLGYVLSKAAAEGVSAPTLETCYRLIRDWIGSWAEHRRRLCYSCRRAVTGSTAEARRAGIQMASIATVPSTSGTSTNVTGSSSLP